MPPTIVNTDAMRRMSSSGTVKKSRSSATRSAWLPGSIETANHADLAVLDRDYFTVPDDDIKRVRSLMTVVGGKVVYNTL